MINSLNLKNFKGFGLVTIPFSPLTVLMGENGVGKSTVIQALLLLRQSLERGDLAGGYLSLNGHYYSVGIGSDLLRQGANEEEIGISLSLSSDGVAEYRFTYVPDADRLTRATPDAAIPEFAQNEFIYLNAERVGPRLTTPRSISKGSEKEFGITGDGALAVLERHRSDILADSDPRRSGESGSLEQVFQMYLAKICPGTRIELQAYGGVDSIGATYTFPISGGLPGSPVRPTNVGFGVSYSLPIIVACLVASPGGLLIVENPEAHLHTKGQRALADLLVYTAQAGVQVIVETHSREIFHWLRNSARNGHFQGDEIRINYFEAIEEAGNRQPHCVSLHPVDGSLAAWPPSFFDAYGSPSDLIAPVATP